MQRKKLIIRHCMTFCTADCFSMYSNACKNMFFRNTSPRNASARAALQEPKCSFSRELPSKWSTANMLCIYIYRFSCGAAGVMKYVLRVFICSLKILLPFGWKQWRIVNYKFAKVTTCYNKFQLRNSLKIYARKQSHWYNCTRSWMTCNCNSRLIQNVIITHSAQIWVCL